MVPAPPTLFSGPIRLAAESQQSKQESTMGKGDRRLSNKMRQRKAQVKKKTRAARRATEVREARAAASKPAATEKKKSRKTAAAAG